MLKQNSMCKDIPILLSIIINNEKHKDCEKINRRDKMETADIKNQ